MNRKLLMSWIELCVEYIYSPVVVLFFFGGASNEESGLLNSVLCFLFTAGYLIANNLIPTKALWRFQLVWIGKKHICITWMKLCYLYNV